MSETKRKSKSYMYRNIKKTITESLLLCDLDKKVDQPSTSKRLKLDACASTSVQSESKLNSSDSSDIESSSPNFPISYEDSSNSDADSPIPDADSLISVSFLNDIPVSPEVPVAPDPVIPLNISRTFLKDWALCHNITHNALDALLTFLKTNPDLSDLPTSARALLNTPKSMEIEELGGGHFYYFGLAQNLTRIIELTQCDILDLDFGIDGLPIYKSSNLSFWPILCKIHKIVPPPVFTVAIFCGKSKPPLNGFFKKFIEEINLLQKNGLKVDNKIIKINIRSFLCDTPARSFIKCVTAHNGYFGCDKCIDKGNYFNRRMRFLKLHATLRTNLDFRSKNNNTHHKGESPLEKIKTVDMINSFPLDYMHSVCLGVMRKLLFEWRDGSRIYRLNAGDFDNYIKSIKHWPFEFNRKPRSILELERWKASELRQFLLYTGCVVLKKLMSPQIYANFMLLKFALTILLSNSLNNDYNHYAQTLLLIFVKNAIKIYGRDFCIYNTHSLIHLANEARLFGDLNSISCFPFENHLQVIKNLLRKPNLPLQQVIRRISERESDLSFQIKKKDIYVMGKPVNPSKVTQEFVHYVNQKLYTKLCFGNKYFSISRTSGNNMVMLKNGQIFSCCFFLDNEQFTIIGKKCDIIKPFTSYPTDSSVFHLYEIQFLSDELVEFSAEIVMCKGVVLPFEDTFVFTPLVHLF